MPDITPFLWFDNQALEAANFYASIFPNSSVLGAAHYDDATSQASGQPEGSVMVVPFSLDGKDFLALNGGPMFKFTEAVSFMIHVKDQAELDYYWSRLTADGGEESMCGWLRDKYGLSWQVVPTHLGELMMDPVRGERVAAALMQMRKIDIAALENA